MVVVTSFGVCVEVRPYEMNQSTGALCERHRSQTLQQQTCVPSAHLGRYERSDPREEGSRHLRAVQGYSPVVAVGHLRRLPVEAPLEAPVFPESHPGRALAGAQQAVDAVFRPAKRGAIVRMYLMVLDAMAFKYFST